MLNEVRFYDSNGNCKKVLSGKNLSHVYWKKINSSQKSSTPMRFGKGKRFNKQQLYEEYDTYLDECFEESVIRGLNTGPSCEFEE